MAAKIQDLLQCPVCLSELKHPRILPCYHSFCESCLETHIQTSSRGRKSCFPCPTCRVMTIAPDNSSKTFPRDFRLVKFRDVVNCIIGKQHGLLCDVCSMESKYETATSFCGECVKYFCDNCTKSHKLKPYLAGHMPIDLRSEQSVNHTENMCRIHATQDIKYTCQTCHLELCVICILKDHEGHSILRQETESLIMRRQLATTFKNVHKEIWKLQENIFNLTCLDGRLKGRYAESKMLIQKKSRKLMQKILGDEKKCLKELDEDFLEKRIQVDQLKDTYRVNLKDMEIYQSQLRSLMTSEQNNKHLQDEILDRINLLQLEMTMNYPSTLKCVKKFIPGSFELGELTEVSLHQDVSEYELALSMLNTQNKIKPNTADITENTKRYQDTGLIQQGVEVKTSLTFSVLPISTFGRHGKSNEQLSLPYNICFSDNDEILVADNGNKCIQIFDKYGHSTKTIGQGDIIPRGITLMNSREIATTDEITRGVKIYNMKGDLLREFFPKCMTLPYAIAKAKNGDFLFTDMIFETVSVIKQNGDLRYQFGGHGCSDNCFDNPGYLIVDARDRILVSDSGNHCVKVYTKHGHFLFKFGSNGTGQEKLRYPKGLASDATGNIFVVDSGNDRVVMFTREGTYIGVVLNKAHGLHRPTGICLSQTNLLAISMPDLGEICVFSISS